MVYNEIKKRNNKTYYYRVISVRKGNKISKKRKYLGVDLSKKEIKEKEKQADTELKKINNPALNKIKPKIIKILKENKIKKAGIFGSYARGDQKRGSDIDILIEPYKGMGFKFFGLQVDLQEKLKRKVDLLTYNSIHPYLKNNILKDEVRIIWKGIKNYMFLKF